MDFIFAFPLSKYFSFFFSSLRFKSTANSSKGIFMQSVEQEIILSTPRRTDSDDAKLLFNLLLIKSSLWPPNFFNLYLSFHHVSSKNIQEIRNLGHFVQIFHQNLHFHSSIFSTKSKLRVGNKTKKNWFKSRL